jgi:hypothetical protein
MKNFWLKWLVSRLMRLSVCVQTSNVIGESRLPEADLTAHKIGVPPKATARRDLDEWIAWSRVHSNFIGPVLPSP